MPRLPSTSPSDTSGTTRVVAAIGLVALLGGIATIVLSSNDGSEARAPTAPVTTTPAATTPATTPRPTRVRVAVRGVGAFDPEGDRSENDGDAVLATDGNGATAWKSEHYRNAFPKSGVGLVVDARRPVRASRVVIVTETPGYRAQVRVGPSPTGPFTAVSNATPIGKRTAISLRPTNARYLLVWITSMPQGGVAAVNEITVASAG